jgi:small GTP-binding protein
MKALVHDSSQSLDKGEKSDSTQLIRLLKESASLLSHSALHKEKSSQKLLSFCRQIEDNFIYLAVLGQFKRGKSTLINALLGEDILPTSVIPLTSFPTFIQYHEQKGVRVIYSGDKAFYEVWGLEAKELNNFLSKYITEEGNPQNRLGLSQVEVYYPSPLLQQGIVLVDTPGIGSTHLHNTEATLNFIPQCDAVIFVISADPPVTEVEIEFLKRIQAKIGRIFFILNKIDYLTPADLTKVMDFVTAIFIQKNGIDKDIRVIPLSAKKGLLAKQTNNPQLFTQSGLSKIEEALHCFIKNDKEKTLLERISQKATSIIDEAVMELELSLRSWRLPIEELEHRLEILIKRLEDINSQMTIEKDLLKGEKERFLQTLNEQAQSFIDRMKECLMREVDEVLQKEGYDANKAQEFLDERLPRYFESELEDFSRRIEGDMNNILKNHYQRSNAIVENIYKIVADLFEIPYMAHEYLEEFKIKRRPYWVTYHSTLALGAPLPEEYWDKILPMPIRKKRVLKRMHLKIEMVVTENVENIRWPTLQNMEKTYLSLIDEFEMQINAVIENTIGVIVKITTSRKAQSINVKKREAEILPIMQQLNNVNHKFHTFWVVETNKTNYKRSNLNESNDYISTES